MKVSFRYFIILVGIILLALVVRLFFLDRIPTAIGGDELEYILNAKSFYLSSKDLTGSMSLYSVFLFQYPPGILPQAELPYFLTFPFLSLSLFSARFPFAIYSVLTVIAIYLLAKELFNNKVALLAAFVTSVNPWMIFIGRTAYEATPAMFFYLLGLWLVLIFKGRKILLSFPVFLLAFYSYIGTKVIFVPFIIAVSFFAYYRNNKQFKKEYISLCLLSLLFIGVFFVLSHEGSRTSEILTPFSPSISEEVNVVRKNSIQTMLTPVLENKFIMYAKVFVDKLLDTFSFHYLFVAGDDFFGQWRHGLFYAIESIFLLIGAYFMANKIRNVFRLIGSLILVSILPQLLHQQSSYFTPHITFLIPLFILLISYGIYVVYEKANKGRRGLLVLTCIGGIYIFSITFFLNQYFTQYPLRGHLDFPSRVLINHARLTAQEKDVLIFTSRPQDIYKKYLFYTNSLTEEELKNVSDSLRVKKFHIQNVRVESCGSVKEQNLQKEVVIADVNCSQLESSESALIVPQLNDGGQVYRIYGDTLCKEYILNTYPQHISLRSFVIEELSAKEFCETFITKQ